MLINYKEHFNMRHTRARNVIEQAFSIMKMCSGILRSATFYPVETQVRLIMACFLLHNFICSVMTDDPIEAEYDNSSIEEEVHPDDVEFISTVEATAAWTTERDSLAQQIFQDWNNGL